MWPPLSSLFLTVFSSLTLLCSCAVTCVGVALCSSSARARMTHALILGSRCFQSHGLEQAGVFPQGGDPCLQRPPIRAGLSTRHPMLSASCDASGKTHRRRPHLLDGLLSRPGSSPGRLDQRKGLDGTSHRNTTYPSLSTAPSGKTPVSRKRHSAMSNLRATATIPIRLTRFPPPPKRSRNQTLRALSG